MRFPVACYTQSFFSFFKGLRAPDAIPRIARRLGYEAVVLADRNSFAGAPAFFQRAAEEGIKPILGLELTDSAGREALFIVQSREGYEAASALLSERNLSEDFSLGDSVRCGLPPGLTVLVSDPRLAQELGGVIPPGQLGILLVRPARSLTAERELLRAARTGGVPCFAAQRFVYTEEADLRVGRVLSAIERGVLIDQTVPPPAGEFFQPAAVVGERFRDLPDAVAATRDLAARAEFSWGGSDLIVPTPPFSLPEEPDRFLRRLAREGMKRRLKPTRTAFDRLDRELAEIRVLGLAGYFLVVWDIVRCARSQGVLCVGRGSGAGSLVSFALGLTPVNPLKAGLLFERFLNRLRPDLPDLDLDLDWLKRDAVIASVYRRYGPERVAMIASYVTFRERLAFREVARASGLPPRDVDRLSARIPYSPRGGGLKEALRLSPCARGVAWDEPPLDDVVALAERLLSLPRHLSIHPAGIVIAHRPLRFHVPLQYAPKGIVVTQPDMYGLAGTGLIKIDLLGNRALGELARTQELIRDRHGRELRLESISLSDDTTAALLQEGRTIGVFQVESPAMRQLLVMLESCTWHDLCVAVALIRPGPSAAGAKDALIDRRNGGEEPCVDPAARAVRAIFHGALKKTCGVFLFDEDLMRVFRHVTGRPFAEGELLRIRLKEGRRNVAQLAPLREGFLKAAVAYGTPPAVAQRVWQEFLRFAGYTYNQSHAAVFSLLAWWLSYAKAHFPEEFFCGILNNHGGMYPTRVLLAEAAREGIEIRGPCVNHSQEEFHLEGRALRMPLASVRSLSQRTQARIRAGRPFANLADFLGRVTPALREAENLIHAGAFDFTGVERPQLLWELAVTGRTIGRRATPAAQMAFPVTVPYPPLPPLSLRQRVAQEIAVLDFSPSIHPIGLFREEAAAAAVPACELGRRTGEVVDVIGVLAAFREVPTKRGGRMAFVSLQDETGWIEVVLFPPAYRRSARSLRGIGPYIVTGRVKNRFGALHLEGEAVRRAAPLRQLQRPH